MNFWVSLWIGVVIAVVALLNRKWAIIITLAGFIPFWLMAYTGIIGPSADLATQRSKMMFDEIVGTYIAGIAFGWIPVLLFGRNNLISKN